MKHSKWISSALALSLSLSLAGCGNQGKKPKPTGAQPKNLSAPDDKKKVIQPAECSTEVSKGYAFLIENRSEMKSEIQRVLEKISGLEKAGKTPSEEAELKEDSRHLGDWVSNHLWEQQKFFRLHLGEADCSITIQSSDQTAKIITATFHKDQKALDAFLA